MRQFSVKTQSKVEFIDITERVHSMLIQTFVREGVCYIFIPHTTAGLTINENADFAVVRDIVMELNKIVPEDDNYAHAEGNSAAHIKASLVGFHLVVPVEGGRLALGRWQGIYLCEFDGPRTRKIVMTALSESTMPT